MSTEITEGQEPENTESEIVDEAIDAGALTDVQKDALIKKLRQENAAKRVKNKATETELEEFKTWKTSQMTEAERTQARAAELEKENASLKVEKLQREVARKHNLDDDLIEFLGGGDENEMNARAEKLAARGGSTDASGETAAQNALFGGSRGKPVAAGKTNFLQDLFDN